MVRKSLLAVLLLAIASPLAAQEEGYTWTSQRADAVAPDGVTNAQMMKQGQIQLWYRFENIHSRGVWQDTDSVPLGTILQNYSQAPISLANRTHYVTVALGLTDDLTILGEASYSHRVRQQETSGGTIYNTNGHQLGDTRVFALYRFFDQGGWRAHIQLGALIPTGEINVFAETPFSTPGLQALPYDMQIGAGTPAFIPGMTVKSQNEHGTVGAQAQGTFFFGTNTQDYRLGNRYMVTGWAAAPVSDYISFSARFEWLKWDRIDGARPGLSPAMDPGNDAFFLTGQYVTIPVGMNFYLPKGTRFAGQRLSLEAVFPVWQKYEGPQLALNWGVNVGWRMSL